TTNAITTGTTTESGSVSGSTATIIVTGTTESAALSSSDSTTLTSSSSSTLEPSNSSTTAAATTTISPSSASTTSAATNPTSVPSSTSENPDSTSSESTSSAVTATESTATDSTSSDSTTPAETSTASTTPPTSESPTASTSTASSSSDTTPAPTTPADTTLADTTPANTTPADTTPAPTTLADTTLAPANPASTTASPSTSDDTTPAETTPASSTPADTTQASSTPASTTLAQTTTIATTTAQPLSVEEQILALILSNGELFLQSTALVDSIAASYLNIDANLDLQANSLSLIEPVENVLLNLTRDVYLTQAKVLHGFLDTLQNIDFIENRTTDNLSNILRIQQQTKNIVTDFEVKVSEVQETILGSTKGLDEKLQLVSRILQDYIKPKVSDLKESFDHLNVSQVNSLDELKNLPSIQNLTGESIVKLTLLNNELSIFNETQENRLNTLSVAVKKWIPTDLDLIEDLLQSLSISQKKTDLAIAVCDNGSHKYRS
ncbi:hypothetical protein KR074_009143, partial [Drosophila pseudoananassae]